MNNTTATPAQTTAFNKARTDHQTGAAAAKVIKTRRIHNAAIAAKNPDMYHAARRVAIMDYDAQMIALHGKYMDAVKAIFG